MKTNKSFSKRLRVTRKGKVLARVPGQNHNNAKENRQKQLGKRKKVDFIIKNKSASRFLANV